MNNSDESLDAENDARVKTELQRLPWTIVGIGTLALIIFAILPTEIDPYGRLLYGPMPVIIGRAIGSLILPGLICLVFKKKSRAFKILWVIYMILSLTGIYAESLMVSASRVSLTH